MGSRISLLLVRATTPTVSPSMSSWKLWSLAVAVTISRVWIMLPRLQRRPDADLLGLRAVLARGDGSQALAMSTGTSVFLITKRVTV